MKKELLILLMIVSTAMILSAEGQQDDADELFYGRGYRGGMMGNYPAADFDREEFFEQQQAARDEYLEDLEILAISGKLSLVNGELPTIESDGVQYYVMAPWVQIEDLNLEDGMDISVEGYEMPGPPMQWDNTEKSIMVTKAVINGEEIDVDHTYGEYGMMGSFGRGGFGGPGRKNSSAFGGMMGRRF